MMRVVVFVERWSFAVVAMFFAFVVVAMFAFVVVAMFFAEVFLVHAVENVVFGFHAGCAARAAQSDGRFQAFFDVASETVEADGDSAVQQLNFDFRSFAVNFDHW